MRCLIPGRSGEYEEGLKAPKRGLRGGEAAPQTPIYPLPSYPAGAGLGGISSFGFCRAETGFSLPLGG